MPIGTDYIFRIDDISVNTQQDRLNDMIAYLREKVPDCRIMLAISPAVKNMTVCEEPLARERVFPAIFHVESDFRIFYKMETIGLPPWLDTIRREHQPIVLASHGMVHVDHRLLKKSAQELSIVMSCSLLSTTHFVPPFHKWNAKTEAICKEHGIDLIKGDGQWKVWRHLAYHDFDRRQTHYYFHTHDFTLQNFRSRFP